MTSLPVQRDVTEVTSSRYRATFTLNEYLLLILILYIYLKALVTFADYTTYNKLHYDVLLEIRIQLY